MVRKLANACYAGICAACASRWLWVGWGAWVLGVHEAVLDALAIARDAVQAVPATIHETEALAHTAHDVAMVWTCYGVLRGLAHTAALAASLPLAVGSLAE